MSKKALFLSFLPLGFCLLLIGCSQTPKPVSYQFTTQKKIQASKHWEILAKDIGQEIIELITNEKKSSNLSIKIMPNNNSSFCRAFRSFIATYLINSGININQNGDYDYKLNWSVQNVVHKSSRKSFPFLGSNTFIASLGYGIYKVFADSTTATKFIATGAAADIVKEVYEINSIKLPKNEIIINVSLKKFDTVKYRFSNIYYINDLDKDHYFFSKDTFSGEKKFETNTYYISN